MTRAGHLSLGRLRSAAVVLIAVGGAVALPAQKDPSSARPVITVGRSVRNDVSPPLRSLASRPVVLQPLHLQSEPLADIDEPVMFDYDPVVQDFLAPNAMPSTQLNFDGIGFPGVSCNCAPPDTNGEVGATQYVQMVNEGVQVFNKATGASVLGPIEITSLWTGLGGVCENNGHGDPVVLYDQLANRWVISQFAGVSIPTDECVAVSTTSDATGSYYRYDFHLGTNFFDYPHLSVWPDAYYLSENVFNSSGTSYLGPQPFALDRAAMLVGAPATFVTPGLQASSLNTLLPADLDGSNLPPAGAPNPWLSTSGSPWALYRFHVDFATPANSTWTLAGNLTPAGFTTLSADVPQLDTTSLLDSLADRPMFRLAYRRFADGHEALVGNRTVSVSSIAGIRWWEITNATSGTPTFVQQGTYQPDTTWRWMGSIAMDTVGNIALGFSASSAAIHPELRYAGRLAGDPAGTMAQGETTLFAGTGSQVSTSSRWGDYSDLTVDPVDDCTFWFTSEYYATTTSFAWRTRIGSFKFPGCSLSPTFSLAATPDPQAVCAPDDAEFTVDVGSVAGFTNAVTLGVTGNPSGTTVGFSPNPVTPPGSSTLTVGNTGGAAPGDYTLSIDGTASGSADHSTDVDLSIFASAPSAPTLSSPADGATGVALRPNFTWSGASGAISYLLEVDDDSDFSSPVYAHLVSGTSDSPSTDLPSSTTLYWRVTANNPCGSTASSSRSLTTVALPGDCAPGSTAHVLYEYSFESGASGWTHSGTGDTWAISTSQPYAGSSHYHADDPATVSDQRLVSPSIALPSGEDPIVLRFWHVPNLELRNSTQCYDGGLLEVSTDSGTTWTQVPDTDLLSGPYHGAISNSFQNPLGGLDAWCGVTSYMQTIADLTAYGGQTVQFRMRLGSDNVVSKPGWNVDDVVVRSCTPVVGDTFLLTVNRTGSGTVTSTPAGIDCGATCAHSFAADTPVSLSASAATGWTFQGWSGEGCSGTGACNVTMSQARTVSATFTINQYLLTVNKTGSGTVTSNPAGINCGGTCSYSFDYNTPVSLSASAATGWTFQGWSGEGCSGTGTCNVTMSQARTVSATFTINQYLLTVNKTGSGTVTSNPAGIDCGGDCTQDYDYNTVVTLSASAATGWSFGGWSGSGCSGTGTCMVTMTAARTVSATFTFNTFLLSVEKTGNGTVTSDPAGIDCGATCAYAFAIDQAVSLSATPDSGWNFIGWSGEGCSGTASCDVTMDQARLVSALFDTMPFLDGFESGDTSAWSLTVSPAP